VGGGRVRYGRVCWIRYGDAVD